MTPDFAAHRRRLLEVLPPDEAVLVFGAPERVRNGDSDYRYRPDSDVFWLTGWEDPEVVVFLRHGAEPLTMFVQPKDKEREVWTGRRAGPEGARQLHGADAAFPIGELETQLSKLLQGVRALHYAFARDADHDALVMTCVARAAKAARNNGLTAPETFHHPSKLLHELRLRKSEDEVAVLRAASELTAEAHLGAMQRGRHGVREFELEGEMLRLWRRAGSTGPGYTPIIASGVNATVLHYHTNRDELRDGDLLLLDAACEVAYYTADVTRTFPASGEYTAAQRQVHDLVHKAQLASLDAVKVGAPYRAFQYEALRVLAEGLRDWGVLDVSLDELLGPDGQQHRRYIVCGTGHYIGLDVHDCDASRPEAYFAGTIEAGMALAVEPGLYFHPNDETVPPELRGIGIRIEDNVVVHQDRLEILTEDLPITTDGLEQWTKSHLQNL